MALELGLAAWTAHLRKATTFIESSLPTKAEYERWISSEAAKAVAKAAPSDTSLAVPATSASAPLPAVLALPAPEQVNRMVRTLDVSTGDAVVLEQLGPVVVNTDGTLSRITNWPTMTDGEKETAKRLIAKRNGTSAATQPMLKRARQRREGTLASRLPDDPTDSRACTVKRLQGFKDEGTLKQNLMSALAPSPAADGIEVR